MINNKFYLKDLSEDDLYMNLIFRALCNSYTLDDGVISYSELTSKAMKEEIIKKMDADMKRLNERLNELRAENHVTATAKASIINTDIEK